ncbi:MAG TPA: gamma-carboxygeranoyl-CoA hydratase [Legionella sp.]|nr:gamma-carboxygeranoyl-CoA hydratase [Legionella sp.]
MTGLLSERQGHVHLITLNRVDKHNAFDDGLLAHLQTLLDSVIADPLVRVIVLKANGKHFSAGADVSWMQRMAQFSEAENLADAQVLARVMYTIHQCPKPTIAMVHGAAFGGGAGLVAACDIAIAAHTARFCFSEVKLGLIPAVISPYVIQAIGEKAATWLFMSAEVIEAQRACELQLVQHCVPDDELLAYTLCYAEQMAQLAPLAVRASKALVREVSGLPINKTLQHMTATLIARQRTSVEGQQGLQAFLKKETPRWN